MIKMCWWIKVSVPLLCNLGSRMCAGAADCCFLMLHCCERGSEATDVIPDELSPEDKEEKSAVSPQKQRGPMSDRPLPIPVENEPYFMNIDRNEAENLLKGHPDGTFVLRPSSQPNHAYTLTVSCSNAVHNIGIRRRPDGRLSLGFARRGERSFTSVTCLIRHHKKRRLLLVAGGDVCGATTLNGTPEYYQTPSSLPLAR